MKGLSIFFILLILSGCYGEKKEKENKKIDIHKLAGILQDVEFDREILVGDGFEVTGHFNFNIKIPEIGEEKNCKGTIFRKEYPESFFYFYIDCYGNFMFNLLRK